MAQRALLPALRLALRPASSEVYGALGVLGEREVIEERALPELVRLIKVGITQVLIESARVARDVQDVVVPAREAERVRVEARAWRVDEADVVTLGGRRRGEAAEERAAEFARGRAQHGGLGGGRPARRDAR